jgi:ribonuclease VapC
MTSGDLAALLAGVELVAFDQKSAELAAAFVRIDRSLSLGDRACLALASIRKAKAWTTDKIWTRAKLPVDLEVLR